MNWTVGIILITLMGSLMPLPSVAAEAPSVSGGERSVPAKAVTSDAEFQVQLAATKKELQLLRQELVQVLKQAEKQNAEFRRLQLSIAATVTSAEKKNFGRHEQELLEALESVSQSGRKLVSRIMVFSHHMGKILAKDEISDVDRARLKYRLEELKSAAEQLSVRVRPGPEKPRLESCRILTVSDQLQVAVLAAGMVDGANSGLVLRVTADGKKVMLKVVAVRTYICAAMVMEGDLKDLAPGMLAVAGTRKQD